MPWKYKNSRYPRDKKGRFKHIQTVKKRGEYYKPGFHEAHHKNKNTKDYRSKNIELKYKGEHRFDHYIERKEKSFERRYK